MKDTTIAAISTAFGQAGIGVIRLSGPDALNIVRKIFSGGNLEPRRMVYGKICDPAAARILDEALCCFMPGPHSYTGEDVVEIQCHSSVVSLKGILELCFSHGALPAERGEFTKRAFLNGRLDLSQAEAVIDLISAKTSPGFDSAMRQAEGHLSRRIRKLRDELKELLVQISVNMDYPDEDIEEITYDGIYKRLFTINDELAELLSFSEEGKILREGLGIAIVGKPNVGKSTLMNMFLGEDRSIVTDIPGTTRDTVEETASVRGFPLRLIDTAGIHLSDDPVEKRGIEKSRRAIESSDLLLIVLDASRELSGEDIEILSTQPDKPAVCLLNKADLGLAVTVEQVKAVRPSAKVVRASVLTGQGADELKDALVSFAGRQGAGGGEEILLSNSRHIDLVKKAENEIAEALKMTEASEALDFIEVNVNAAFRLLGEITGDTADGEIIDEIFSRFCLGK